MEEYETIAIKVAIEDRVVSTRAMNNALRREHRGDMRLGDLEPKGKEEGGRA